MSLLNLPEELILEIAKNSSYSALGSLIRTCKRAYRIAYPVLYSSVLTPEQKHEVFIWAGYKKREDLMLQLLPHIPQDPISQYYALASAARCGSAEVIHALVKNGAPLNFDRPEFRNLQPHWRYHSTLDIWRKMLWVRRGVAEATYDSFRDSPFAAAARNQDIETLKLLVQLGADPKEDDDGENPLRKAVNTGNVELVKTLLDLGIELMSENHYVRGLMMATRKGYYEIMRLILRAHAPTREPYAIDQYEGPLTCAAARGDLEATNILLDAGANPRPICRAARDGDIQIVKTLLAANARADVLDHNGNLMHNTIQGDSVDILQLLFTHGVPLQVLSNDLIFSTREEVFGHVVGQGSSMIARFLLDLWPDLNIDYIDDSGLTPLAKAAQQDYIDIAQALISRNADVNKTDGKEEPPIMWAILNGHHQILSMLLEAGATHDISARMEWGDKDTPLSWACGRGYHEVAAVLLRAGADITHRDKNGRTLLMNAVRLGDLKLVDLLLDWNIDIDSVDNRGYTARYIAGFSGWEFQEKMDEAEARRKPADCV
ncbi:ankyrin repeat-containing domain protein [Aspergillus californicus]